MKRILIFVLIACTIFLLIAGAQEKVDNSLPENMKDYKDDMPSTGDGKTYIPEPAPKPVTHLKVTMFDGINDKIFELKDCVVQIVGNLHMVDNIFPYQKTFSNGSDYEITIWIKPKD